MMLNENEIYGSYRNAKRIQDTILPEEKFIKQVIPDSFIIYLPRDTISGDFYWVEEVNDTVLFAVGDCTGHGIPGAMLTVMCHRALERSLKEFGMVVPGHILDKTLEILVNDFRKNEQTIADGMDIALCALTGNFLQFSGANNPLWIVSNGTLITKEATKQPIGLVDNPAPFVTEEFNLTRGDTLYIFSDGFSDQFGGEGDKKFKPAQLRDLLISLNHQSMNDQKILLERAFLKWKGTSEQVDDVCIMGVRI